MQIVSSDFQTICVMGRFSKLLSPSLWGLFPTNMFIDSSWVFGRPHALVWLGQGGQPVGQRPHQGGGGAGHLVRVVLQWGVSGTHLVTVWSSWTPTSSPGRSCWCSWQQWVGECSAWSWKGRVTAAVSRSTSWRCRSSWGREWTPFRQGRTGQSPESVTEWVSERVSEWVGESMRHDWLSQWDMIVWINECINELINECMDVWMNECIWWIQRTNEFGLFMTPVPWPNILHKQFIGCQMEPIEDGPGKRKNAGICILNLTGDIFYDFVFRENGETHRFYLRRLLPSFMPHPSSFFAFFFLPFLSSFS